MDDERAIEVLAKEAAALLGRLGEADLTALVDDEVLDHVRATHELLARATAAHTAAVARLDASRAWVLDQARSATDWVAWQTRTPRSHTRRLQRCGRELRSMRLVAAAFADGELTPDHVHVLRSAQQAAPTAFEAAETQLLGLARELTWRPFCTAVRYWCQLHAPDDEEVEARRRYEDRHLHASTTFEGTVAVDGVLPAVGGAIVQRELARLEQQLFDADWAEARARLGDLARTTDLVRTPAQRRADALVEMATRSASLTDGSGRARPLVSVTVGHDAVRRLCELSNGQVVTPGEVLPLLCDADLERIVFGSPSRVLDVGMRQRFFAGATRRAVQLRDRGCAHPSCDEPAERCEVDHVLPYEEGGLTIQANGTCRCPTHHRWRHGRPPPGA